MFTYSFRADLPGGSRSKLEAPAVYTRKYIYIYIYIYIFIYLFIYLCIHI